MKKKERSEMRKTICLKRERFFGEDKKLGQKENFPSFWWGDARKERRKLPLSDCTLHVISIKHCTVQ